MEPQTIDLRVPRDVSGVLGATAALLRQSGGRLMRLLLLIVAPLSLGNLLIAELLDTTELDLLSLCIELIIVQPVAFVIGFMWVESHASHERDESIVRDIGVQTQRMIAPMIAVAALTSIAIAVGLVLLIVPGVYLWAATSIAGMVLVSEGLNPFRATLRSVNLVRGHWWATFGLVATGTIPTLVLYFIVDVVAFVAVHGLEAADTYWSIVGWIDAEPVWLRVTMLTLQVFQSLLWYALMPALLGVHYFSLLEKKEGPGSRLRIESIGAVS